MLSKLRRPTTIGRSDISSRLLDDRKPTFGATSSRTRDERDNLIHLLLTRRSTERLKQALSVRKGAISALGRRRAGEECDSLIQYFRLPRHAADTGKPMGDAAETLVPTRSMVVVEAESKPSLGAAIAHNSVEDVAGWVGRADSLE